jgi:hypothetical protein
VTTFVGAPCAGEVGALGCTMTQEIENLSSAATPWWILLRMTAHQVSSDNGED